jgi:glycosyltransferase involved in cell wall biosynthesis
MSSASSALDRQALASDAAHRDAPQPTVSVVVPTHFRNESLAAALDSVAAQIYGAVETVVVDDSGERHAASVVADYDVTYVAFDENRGSNAARSAGFAATSGRYVQLLDDDDRLHPEKLARQVALLESLPDVGVVYCGMRFPDGRTATPDPAARGVVLDRALAFDLYPCQTSTMLATREALAAVFPAPPRPGADDLAYAIELAQQTEFDFVAEPLVERGGGPDSRGSSLGVYRGRLALLDEYAPLYESRPDWVRRRALVSTYLYGGEARLKRTPWSAGAVADFARAAWLRRDAYTVGLCLASLFGRPGVALGARLRGHAPTIAEPPPGSRHGPRGG